MQKLREGKVLDMVCIWSSSQKNFGRESYFKRILRFFLVVNSVGVPVESKNISRHNSNNTYISLKQGMTGIQYNCCMLGVGQTSKRICDIRYLLSKLRIKLKGDRSKLNTNTEVSVEHKKLVQDKKLYHSLRRCRRNGRDIIYRRCCLNPGLR